MSLITGCNTGSRLTGAVAALAMIACYSAFAGSPVWKVSGDGKELFLGGTIHVLTREDYPLPAAFNQAYDQSSILMLEADLAAFQDPALLPQLMSSMMYTDGTTLEQVLSASSFNALQDYCNSRGLPIALFQGLKPGMAIVMITGLELERLGLAGTGVDEHFRQRATDQGRDIVYLESAQQQIAFITEMGAGREDEYISYSIGELDKIPELMISIKSAWREGDLDAMEKIILETMKLQFPGTYDTLVVKRNLAWLPVLESLMQTADTEFVLVGALHLAGDQGLLSLLRMKGYTVTPQ